MTGHRSNSKRVSHVDVLGSVEAYGATTAPRVAGFEIRQPNCWGSNLKANRITPLFSTATRSPQVRLVALRAPREDRLHVSLQEGLSARANNSFIIRGLRALASDKEIHFFLREEKAKTNFSFDRSFRNYCTRVPSRLDDPLAFAIRESRILRLFSMTYVDQSRFSSPTRDVSL